MNPRFVAARIVVGLFAAVPALFAQSPPSTTTPQPATTTRPSAPRELTVAVLDFAANAPGEPELGKQVAEAMTAMLSGEGGFRLVDRALLTRSLQEQELNLSGLVEGDQAVKVGRIVGARLLVCGRVAQLGSQLMLTARLVGTETSLIEAVLVKGDSQADIGKLVIELAGKVRDKLRESGSKLVAQDDAGADPLVALKARLSSTVKPTVAVVIPEHHTGMTIRLPDPAAETEIKKLLRECGFTVRDVEQNALTELVRHVRAGEAPAWPKGLDGVDYVISGEGLSEFAARIGNLVSCGARVEINMISRQNGTIALADRTTQRGVDLSENIAAKSALEKSGRVLALQILTYFADQAKH